LHAPITVLLWVAAAGAGAPGEGADLAWQRIAPYFIPPPEYAGSLGTFRSPLLFDDGTQVRTASDWPRRRREILDGWRAVTGSWPPLIEKPRIEYLESRPRETFIQIKVRVETAPGQATPGYLLVPNGAGPFPAVFVPFYEPETSAGLNESKLRDFAHQLTRRGFVTLSIGSPGGDARKPDTSGLTLQPLSFLGYVAANCYNALASLAQVDPNRVGVVGHSYGGKWALFGSCLFEKYAAAAWSDPGIVWDEARPNVNYWEPWYLGLDPQVTRKPGVITPESPRTGAYRKLLESGRDLVELHALMAPRPFLVSGGSEDTPSRWPALNHSIAVNRLLGFENRVAMTNRQGHDPTPESNEAIYLFFEHFLGSPAAPDLIAHHGKIVTADPRFSIGAAMAIHDGKVQAVGSEAEVLARKGPGTVLLDLGGKTVLPGLIDSHVHPEAAMTEFDHPIPDMESIEDVLAYVRSRAQALGEGQWIGVEQVFITRLKDQRYPTREELDRAAPMNPVVFSTGPDASLSTLALKLSGIDRSFQVKDGGPGYAEKDPATGEPTGILRGCTRYVKQKSSGKTPGEEDHRRRTIELFKDYNAAGLTTVGDRAAEPDAIARYRRLRDAGELTVRLAVSQHVETLGSLVSIEERIREIARSPLREDDPMLRIIGIKTFLDGGMLTGSAYMLEPWGQSKIYSITDPAYRGVLLIPPERLLPIVLATAEAGLQFTAHSVGDGAVRTLLDAYQEVGRRLPPGALRATRPCITHSNFVHPDDVKRFRELGVLADVQPIWLHLDARTLAAQFGYQRVGRFQPLHDLFQAGAVVGGGSDHMQKIGARRAINSYDPFLGMATAITRKARWYQGQLHPEEALTREEAIRLYTTNNAYLLFMERQVGSLEPGKLADFIVIDRDPLSCPAEEIESTRVERTYLGGKLVFSRE
jgi:predicted amidohydrolase YtcJ